ncbi:LuxR C-terminal-related transcriptional regulator [Geodermatophilus sp. URMC 64]
MARLEVGEPVLAEARELFGAFRWRACVELLSEADASMPLDGDGLLLLGEAAYLIGADEQAATALGRAYRSYLDAGDVPAAARCAVYCAFALETSGQRVRYLAWAARAERLLEEHGLAGGAEAGWLLAHRAHELLLEQHVEEALTTARDGERTALAAGDTDAVVLSRLTIGFALLLRGDGAAAIRVFDEVMLAVSSDETSPAVVGLCYCVSVAACVQLRDIARARSWTATLDRWVSARPDLVAYRGSCLVHRAQLSTLGGNWAGALGEAGTALDLLEGTPAAGQAAYQLGELHRLMGHDREAENAYRRANALGVQPEPGLSRLRVAQGRAAAAARTLGRLCGEPRPPEDRAELLAARVEAELALGGIAAARAGADELRGITEGLGSPLLSGLADQADGAVLLAEGRPGAALDVLRRAQRRWTELDLPHPCAQVRVLAGRCLRALGDPQSADLEFEAARECFERLGAVRDLATVDGPIDGARPGRLTEREVEVVRLVAAGHTNRAIANRLCLSEKTVARHLANIYAKLDVPSRAAATAYAYDHGLV